VELRRGARERPPDRRRETYAVLDQIEATTADEPDLRLLVDRARGGDDLAFGELYICFFDRVNRYLLIALKNPDDALEAAQQVFVKLLEALPGHPPLREPFRVWLFQVVRNHAIDHRRKRGRIEAAAAHELPLCDADLLERTSSMRLGDGASGIASLIDCLPRAQQRVLVLRYVYGFTAVEIADTLDTSPDGVRHMHARALRTLARTSAR
jgi:RNA polymerase sigma-70 factor (ECF subfamily)